MFMKITLIALFLFSFNPYLFAIKSDDIHWTQKIFRADEHIIKKNKDGRCLDYNDKKYKDTITNEIYLTLEECQNLPQKLK